MRGALPDERVRAFAHEVMADDLIRMEYTPGNFYNIHPGSHVGRGIEAGIELAAGLLPFYLETPNESEGHAQEIRLLRERYMPR